MNNLLFTQIGVSVIVFVIMQASFLVFRRIKSIYQYHKRMQQINTYTNVGRLYIDTLSVTLQVVSTSHLALIADFPLLNACSSSKPNDDIVGYGTASKHALLLDPREAGRIYVDGQLVLSLCDDESSTSLSSSCSLFGYDLVNIPTSRSKNGLRITDFDAMKRAVGTLIQECLVDASQGHKQIGAKLLNRLIHGKDSSMALVAGGDGTNGSAAAQSLSTPTPIVGTCLESEVVSNKKHDPVGMSCKAHASILGKLWNQLGGQNEMSKMIRLKRALIAILGQLSRLKRHYAGIVHKHIDWFLIEGLLQSGRECPDVVKIAQVQCQRQHPVVVNAPLR